MNGAGSARHLVCVVFVIVFVSGMLAGCSPQYDWRMVAVADGGARAMLPAKPQTAERDLVFEGHELTFILTSASVDGVLFTVGYTALPDALQADASSRLRLVQQTQTSLYRNLGAVPPSEMPAMATQFSIAGQGGGKALQLEAIVWATQDALIEGLVIGPADGLPQLQVSEFFRELAPDLRPR